MLAPPDAVGTVKVASFDVAEIRRELDDHLYDALDGIVQSGAFKGMKLMRETAWRDTRLAPLLLGCYEEDLDGEIERQITRLASIAEPKIGVIGCAEGYYAVGLKRRLPNANVFAVDVDEASLQICGRAAVANGVSLIANAPIDVVLDHADFLLLDCEGHEVAYLDMDKYPSLAGTTMLVEVHNWPGQKTDEILLDRFRGTHRITMIFEGPRNPSKYPSLHGMTGVYRWLAMDEGRPCLMGWYAMQPKGCACTN